MRSYYSIIKVNSKSDVIAIGMVMSCEDRIHVQFSERKLRLAKKLFLNNRTANFLDQTVKLISNKIVTLNQYYNKLFDEVNYVSADRIEHLEKISNNLVSFNKPYFIKSRKYDEEEFMALFTLLVTEEANDLFYKIDEGQKLKSQHFIEEKLIIPVQNQVHTHFKFTSVTLPSLYFTFEMDVIGRNGVLTGAKSIPIDEQKITTIHHKMSDYLTIITILEQRYGKMDGNKFFAISKEPEVNSGEHKLWEQFRNLPKVELIDPEEVDKIAELIIGSNAKKFLPISGQG